MIADLHLSIITASILLVTSYFIHGLSISYAEMFATVKITNIESRQSIISSSLAKFSIGSLSHISFDKIY
jgi:hypothetical protein